MISLLMWLGMYVLLCGWRTNKLLMIYILLYISTAKSNFWEFSPKYDVSWNLDDCSSLMFIWSTYFDWTNVTLESLSLHDASRPLRWESSFAWSVGRHVQDVFKFKVVGSKLPNTAWDYPRLTQGILPFKRKSVGHDKRFLVTCSGS